LLASLATNYNLEILKELGRQPGEFFEQFLWSDDNQLVWLEF